MYGCIRFGSGRSSGPVRDQQFDTAYVRGRAPRLDLEPLGPKKVTKTRDISEPKLAQNHRFYRLDSEMGPSRAFGPPLMLRIIGSIHGWVSQRGPRGYPGARRGGPRGSLGGPRRRKGSQNEVKNGANSRRKNGPEKRGLREGKRGGSGEPQGGCVANPSTSYACFRGGARGGLGDDFGPILDRFGLSFWSLLGSKK